MASRLHTLVQGTNDIYLLDYVLENLGVRLPPDNPGAPRIDSMRQAALQRKLQLLWIPLAKVKRELTQQEIIQRRRENRTALKDKVESLRALSRQDMDELREKLRHLNPMVRLETVQVVALKRLHLESELIDRLTDPQPVVREAAHQALILLSRGTDFGPWPQATPTQQAEAIHKWRAWLAVQELPIQSQVIQVVAGTFGLVGSPASSNVVVRAANDKSDPLAVPLQGLESEAARVSARLLQAPLKEQEELIRELQAGKGASYTEALAAVIPQLAGNLRALARDALAERLTRMTAETLRDKLKDDNGEIRRAAALACAMKEDKSHVPDLIALLEDQEPSVTRAVRAALRELTGQDLGPGARAWKEWWAKQRKDR